MSFAQYKYTPIEEGKDRNNDMATIPPTPTAVPLDDEPAPSYNSAPTFQTLSSKPSSSNAEEKVEFQLFEVEDPLLRSNERRTPDFLRELFSDKRRLGILFGIFMAFILTLTLIVAFTSREPKFNIKNSWSADVSFIFGKSAENMKPVKFGIREGRMLFDRPNQRVKLSIGSTLLASDVIYNQGWSYSVTHASGVCRYKKEKNPRISSLLRNPKFKSESSFEGKKCNLFVGNMEEFTENICITESGELVYYETFSHTSDDTVVVIVNSSKTASFDSKAFLPETGCIES